MKPHLIIYDDSPVFGGHEVMGLEGLRALLQEDFWQITCLYSQANQTLSEHLQQLQQSHPRLTIQPMPLQSARFQGWRNLLQPHGPFWLRNWLSACRPTALLAWQGDIELSSMGLLAARHLNIPNSSYLALPHTLATMGAKLGKWRDLLHSYLLRLPEHWIVISTEMQRILRSRGGTQESAVVFNGFDLQRFAQAPTRAAARAALHLPEQALILGMVGRIEFQQKGHDRLLKVLPDLFRFFPQLHFVVVGDGPDRSHLESEIAQRGWSERVHLLPWTRQTELIYPALDLLVLPSRFEGVPLVMLEALACGIPVCGTDRDGMREVLPEAWQWSEERAGALLDTLRFMLENPAAQLVQAQRELALQLSSREQFARSFCAAVRDQLAPTQSQSAT